MAETETEAVTEAGAEAETDTEAETETETEAATVTGPRKPAAGVAWRLVAVGVLIAGLWIAGKVTGLSDEITTESIRAWTAGAGPWGWLAYIGAFTVGLLIGIPGMIFHVAAVLAYGKVIGALLAYAGALVAVTVKFAVIRAIGGKALGSIERPWVKRLLARLDRRPVAIVGVLRAVFFTAPWLNYAFALTPVPGRKHFAGSALGLILPAVLGSAFWGWIFG